jgi:hypothetical protein
MTSTISKILSHDTELQKEGSNAHVLAAQNLFYVILTSLEAR